MENYEYIVLYDYYDNNVDLENNMFYGMRVAKKTLIYSVQELKKDNCISKNNLSFFFHHSIKKFKRIF